MNAVGYCRVSSQDQIDGTSLSAQENQIRAYAAMKGLELTGIFIDPGVSGSRPLASRPEGARMVEALDEAQAQAVIITKLDRGFRSASDCLNSVETWQETGIALHILNLGGQTIDTSTPTGKFFITIMAGAAELERNLIRERCNEGRKLRRAEGKRLGEIPYGWHLDQDGKSLVQAPEEQEALTLIRDMSTSGLSLRDIAAELNRRQFRAKKGGLWTHSQVQSVLRRAA